MVTAVVVLGYVLTLGALIDGARRPSYLWVEADRNRGYWLSGLVFGLLVLPIGTAMAIGYLYGVLPRITHAARTDDDAFRRQP